MAGLSAPQLFTGEPEGTAIFSADRTYRYTLTRDWEEGPRAVFVMLNPSIATDVLLDSTVRRCIGFAKAWGMGGITVVNIFALRSRDPKALYTHPDPVGPDNDRHLVTEAERAAVVVAAWGVHGELDGRGDAVCALLGHVPLHCLGRTKRGHPRHPLYLPGTRARETF